MILAAFSATTLLMAGGNIASRLATTAKSTVAVPAKVCKENKIYKEKDAALMWQDQAFTEAETGAVLNNKSKGKAGSFYHAKRYCRVLNYGGYTDWRLPTADELVHIHGKPKQAFTYFRDRDFWTSTPVTKDRYFVVFPADAYRYARSPRQSNFVRCVRCIAK